LGRVRASGISDFARTLGFTVGLVGRLVPTPTKPDAQRPPSKPRGKARADTSQSLRRLREELTADVARLETRLDRLHERLATGVDPSAGIAEVSSLVEQARRVRAELDEKRDELVRIERHLTRERVLAPSDAGEAGRPLSLPPPAQARAIDAVGDVAEQREKERRRSAKKIAKRAPATDRYAQKTLQRLSDMLFDDDPHIRRESAQRLAEFGGETAVRLLQLALEDPHERVRMGALNALSLVDGPERVATFRRFLRDEGPMMRLAALRGLSTIGQELKRSELLAALADNDARVRAAAASWLGARRDRAALRALVFALSDDDQEVRAAAAVALGTLGDDGAVLGLIRALGDESAAVRAAVQWALRNLVGEEIESVGLELEGDDRIAALKSWWSEARIATSVARSEGPSQSAAAFETSVAPAPKPRVRAERKAAAIPSERPAEPQRRPQAAPPRPARAKEVEEEAEVEEEESLLDAAPSIGAAASQAPEAAEEESLLDAEPGDQGEELAATSTGTESAIGEAGEEASEESGEGQFEDVFGGGEPAAKPEPKVDEEKEPGEEGEEEDEEYESLL
jgi:HEAT repeat protein